MGIFSRLFKKDAHDIVEPETSGTLQQGSDWEKIPGYIPADEQDYEMVSVIATALAAEHYPDSQFVVKNIQQRNPEVLEMSVIAASLASIASDGHMVVKSIYKKKS